MSFENIGMNLCPQCKTHSKEVSMPVCESCGMGYLRSIAKNSLPEPIWTNLKPSITCRLHNSKQCPKCPETNKYEGRIQSEQHR